MVEVTHIPSGKWFLQIPSRLLSRCNKLGVYRKRWLRYILFDRTSILFVEQDVMSTQYTVSWCLFHFCLYNARRGWVKSSLYGSLWFLFVGFTAVKNTFCLSLLRILTSRYQSWVCDRVWTDCTSNMINVLEDIVRNWTPCHAVQDQWDCVLNDLEELGDEGFLVLTDQYSIETFSCCLRLLPSCSSIHFIRPILRVLKFIPMIIFQSPEFDRSIFFSR